MTAAAERAAVTLPWPDRPMATFDGQHDTRINTGEDYASVSLGEVFVMAPTLIAHAKGIAHTPQKHSSPTEAWQNRRREARTFYAAALRRDRAIARAAITSGADAASRREDELWVPIRAARSAVHNFPVASLVDLAAKLDFIEQDSGLDGDDLLPLVMADVARLSGGEA